MRFIKYFSFFLLLSTNILFSQKELEQEMNVILKLENSNEIVSRNELISKLQNLFSKYKNQSNSLEKGILNFKIGEKYYQNSDLKVATLYFKRAVIILELYKKTNLELLNKIRLYLAGIYFYQEKENDYYLILKKIANDNGTDNHTINAVLYLSVLEANKGDYYTGLKRLNILLSENTDIDLSIRLHMNIIKIYSIMYESNSSVKSKSNFEIIKNIHYSIDDNFNKSSLNESQLYNTYNNLANLYQAFGDSNKAIKLYNKAKEYYKKQEDISKMLDVMNNLGFVYATLNKDKIATAYFDEVIQKTDDIYQKATAYDNKGYFLNTNSSLQKIPYFQKAIQIILEREEAVFSTPSLDLIRESGNQQEVLIYSIDLAFYYTEAYNETKEKKYLLKAKETLYQIDNLVSLIRYESNAEQSKLFWIEKGVNTYMLAVEVCYLLNKPDEAFYFIEKNKALLLQENIKVFQAKLELEIPKKIQEREYKLHYELQAIEKQIQINANDALLKFKYTTKNNEFIIFMDSLRKKYPDYAKVKQEIEIININKVVKPLTKEECFITYILNENDGYGIFCNQQEKIFFKIENVSRFQKDIITLKSLMKQRLLAKDKTVEFQKLSYSIFNSLFPFKDTFSKIKGKKMVIVPDASLLDLPFEALSINLAQSLSKSYFINYTEISYLQSFSVFEKIKQKRNKPIKKLLAIAPYQFEDKQLPDLIRSKEAINALNIYSSTEILIGKEATKVNFYNKSREFEILHLNTHAGIDSLSESPWISFRNDKLTLDELYGIDSQAELVILDACKTNDGKFASGEGILSLSRGFFNNGSKSVLASLWNVNEKAGNDIIATFYKELVKGKTKSKALQLAKINYLKEHQFSEVLPYYWASFTLTGSTKPIELSKSYFQGIPLLIIISSLLLILGLIYFKRKLLFS